MLCPNQFYSFPLYGFELVRKSPTIFNLIGGVFWFSRQSGKNDPV